jgi:L-fuculose-phosphate aldolase
MKTKIKELVKYSHLIACKELVLGSSGNISVKIQDKMLIKATGCYMSEAKPGDFMPVGIKNLKFNHKKLKPSCESRMHASCYKARPDINCVMHTHPLYATTLSSCSIKPKLISPEFILCLGTGLKVIDYICPGTRQLADTVGEAVKSANIIYLKNHGLLAVGKDLKQAYIRTLLAEQMAKMQIISSLLGKNLKGISSKQAAKLLTHLKGQ